MSIDIEKFIAESTVDETVYKILKKAIDKHQVVMIYVQKVSGKSGNAVFQPKAFRLIQDKESNTRAVVIGNKADKTGQFVQYYLDSIYKCAVFDEDGNLTDPEETRFETPNVFKDSKFKEWGHF